MRDQELLAAGAGGDRATTVAVLRAPPRPFRPPPASPRPLDRL